MSQTRAKRSPAFEPSGPVSIALTGLTTVVAGNHASYFRDFGRFMKADSPDAALRQLFALRHPRAVALLERYRADLEARGRAKHSIESHLTAIRGAVRLARRGGDTNLNLDTYKLIQISQRQKSMLKPDGPLTAIAIAGRKPKGAQNYLWDLSHFARFLDLGSTEEAITLLIGMTHERANRVVADYLAHLKERGLAQSTIACTASTFRGALRNLRIEGRTTVTIDLTVEREAPARLTGGIALRDFGLILSTAIEEAEVGGGRSRNPALLLLLYDRALRPGEASDLDLDDVDIRSATPRIRVAGKWLAINERTRVALQGWIETRGDSPGALFLRGKNGARGTSRMTAVAILKVVKRLGEKAGLTRRVLPLDLRTSAISLAAELGYDSHSVQTFARTGREAGVVERVLADREKEDIGALFPRGPGRSGSKRRSPEIVQNNEDALISTSDVFLGDSAAVRPRIGRKELPCLTDSEFDVLLVLKKYEPNPVVTSRLDKESNHRQSDKIIRKLIKKVPIWGTRILFPKAKGRGGIRLGHAEESDASRLAQNGTAK